MNSKLFILVAAMSSGSAFAQNSYDAANFATGDLNGTARYVGMGGALGALGGDISTMGSNPAATAMFRKAEAAFTFGGQYTSNSGAIGHDKSRMSFDNGGVVIALPTEEGALKYVNFGVNYQKSKNFLGNLDTSIGGLNNTFSQTFQITDLANNCLNYDSWGTLADMATPTYNSDGSLSKDGILVDHYDAEGNLTNYSATAAQQAHYSRATWGGLTQTDLNVSFNILDKYFFGASLGVYDVDYNRESVYAELGTDGKYYDLDNWYTTTGDGFDVKLGFICRPIDNSPFRFGVTVHTPTWYRLEDTSGSSLYYQDKFVCNYNQDPYDYNYRTPWKFGFNLGYTVGNYFAIGAEYEFQDLSSGHYSQDGYETNYFRTQNQFIKDNLRGQSTLKVGMEVKPVNAFSIRAGYNFISAPIKKSAYNVLAYDSPFTETDFTNWKDTHRFTFGLGYRYKGGYIDLAYQYMMQKGDFYAFDEVDLEPTKINNDRSQIMCTLGFRF